MISRRLLLQLVGATPAISSMKTVEEKLKLSDTLEGYTVLPEPQVRPGPDTDLGSRLLSHLYDLNEAEEATFYRTPIDITTKKSWSASFKHHCTRERFLRDKAIRRALERNEVLAIEVAKKLGLG